MHRRAFLLGSLAVACGAPARPGRVVGGAPFRVIDTMPAFWAYWDEARTLAIDDAVALFDRTLRRAHPEIYAPSVLQLPVEGFDAALAQRVRELVERMPRIEAALRAVDARAREALDEGVARFVRAIPDFDWDGDCYLMVSLDAFNGAGRLVRDRAALLFGLDVIADRQPDADPLLLVHHELYHFYQHGPPEPPTLSDMLWIEGLATYASLALNPGARVRDALPFSHLHDPSNPRLDDPERRIDFERDMPRYRAELGAMLLERLGSSESEDYQAFFLGRAGDRLGERPVRSAYYFGLRVVERLARGRTLVELGALDPLTQRDAISEALRSIVDG
jgi:hypothetical protein